MPAFNYQFLLVENIGDFVVHVKLNNPKKLNTLNEQLWSEIGDVFTKLEEEEDCRVVILSGEGRAFTTGMDLTNGMIEMIIPDGTEVARPARRLRRKLVIMQDSFTRIEKCTKPVIAAIHGYCKADGMAIISASDIRHCSSDVIFSINEIDGSLAPDMGSLMRIPKVIGNESWLRELSFTARNFGAEEALKHGLVSKIYDTKETMIKEVTGLAKYIAKKSPVAVQGSKVVLNYSRDHTVDDSLNFVATWNQSQLFTEDIPAAGMAVMTKSPPPPFAKL